MNLASIFTDGCVLQRRMPIRIFGEGNGPVTVSFLGKTQSMMSTNDKWCLEFPAEEAGGPYEMRVTFSHKTVILSDIMIGEVWIAAGQSNMEMPVFRTETGLEDAHNYQNDQIRFFTVPRRMKKDRTHIDWNFGIMVEEDTPWQVCNEQNSLKFSAIGYYTAKELQKNLNVPVGIISVNWGGRQIEPFISRNYCDKCESLKKIKADFDAVVAKTSADEYEKELEEIIRGKNDYFTNEVGDALALVKKVGVHAARELPNYRLAPNISTGIYDTFSIGTLWDSMVSRIVPYGVKGMMWYQGESNGEQLDYFEKYKVLLESYRTEFQNPTMPVYAVELASYWNWEGASYQYDKASFSKFVTDNNWAFLREQQQKATQLPESYLVSTQELSGVFDIHPIYKKPLCHRMANKILAHTYGFAIPCDNPTFKSATFKDGKAILEFNNAKGLFAFELGSVNMLIAGADKVLHTAVLTIQNDKIIAQSDSVPDPRYVRYGFDYAYFGSHLYNENGLPLSPFRTDCD